MTIVPPQYAKFSSTVGDVIIRTDSIVVVEAGSPDDKTCMLRGAFFAYEVSGSLNEVFEKIFPTPKLRPPAELNRHEQERKEAIGDRAPEEWFDETEAAIPGGEANRSRFQERFEADQKKGK